MIIRIKDSHSITQSGSRVTRIFLQSFLFSIHSEKNDHHWSLIEMDRMNGQFQSINIHNNKLIRYLWKYAATLFNETHKTRTHKWKIRVLSSFSELIFRRSFIIHHLNTKMSEKIKKFSAKKNRDRRKLFFSGSWSSSTKIYRDNIKIDCLCVCVCMLKKFQKIKIQHSWNNKYFSLIEKEKWYWWWCFQNSREKLYPKIQK